MLTMLRKIGNSTGTIIPVDVLQRLNLKAGDRVNIEAHEDRIVIQPSTEKPRYTLDELLAQCDETAPYPDALSDWDNAPNVGQESW